MLDKLLLDGPEDRNYRKIRQSLVLVEFAQEDMPAEAFVDKLFLDDNHDAKLIKVTDGYIIHIRTKKGEALLNRYLEKTAHEPKERKVMNTFLKDMEFKEGKNQEVFDKHSKTCIACGACTLTCPTCPCFLVKDIINIRRPDCGKRCRLADSCQFPDFSDIAGGMSSGSPSQTG